MMYNDYKSLKIRVERGVMFATIDHPPINLFDVDLMKEISRLTKEVINDDSVRVMVFDSANPEFFIAHADVNQILLMPTELPPKPTAIKGFQGMVERYRTMPKVSIAKIEGRTGGGGSEFVLSLDMRFAAIGRTFLSQPEVGLGILPGGSGTQRLPRLIGRSRALEVILGCQNFSAELAERYGYINRAFPQEELTPFVENLAFRIASFPKEAIAQAKAAVLAAELPTREGLLEEGHAFHKTLTTQSARERMTKFLAIGGQTREVEIGLEEALEKLAD